MPSSESGEARAAAVWRVVRRIPRGKVASYGDVGALAGCTARQAGWALGKAHAGARLPWHRVLRAGGVIALPAEKGLEQRLRLEAEGVTFRGRRVRMELHRWRGPAD